MFIWELQKEKYHGLKIADLGCGEGWLALEVTKSEVLSYDIGKLSPHVIQADIADLPLEKASIDVAVFCLSLMGTNYTEFLLEATRILKQDGLLMIAEVTSRFTNLKLFKKILGLMGFQLLKETDIEDYFKIFIFKKTDQMKKKRIRKIILKEGAEVLKPCIYKKR